MKLLCEEYVLYEKNVTVRSPPLVGLKLEPSEDFPISGVQIESCTVCAFLDSSNVLDGSSKFYICFMCFIIYK